MKITNSQSFLRDHCVSACLFDFNDGVQRCTQNRITILLCTFNGAAYLDAQLQSYLAQTHQAWDLWISDDGSSDGTRAILKRFRRDNRIGRDIRILEGPRQGSTANFMTLLCHPDLPSGPVALSDQDDVWLPQKLTRALAALEQVGSVALYGAQSLHTDQFLRVTGQSAPMPRAPSFGNALVQNIVSGHSATLSADAMQLVRRAGVPQGVPHHDWWLYQLISGAGGTVVIDSEAVLLYRQHNTNVMGAHRGLPAHIHRVKMVIERHFGAWLTANVAALTRVDHLLSASNKTALAQLRAHPRHHGLRRAIAFARCGIKRQSRAATAFVYFAVMLGRA